ncbi:MAG: S41 family peptidase [Planctomycetales bacterium]|nr:S41 family peptidase [Planctomycetales bacterium]
MPSRNLATIILTLIAWVACAYQASHLRYAAIISHAIGQVTEYYVEPVEHRELFENAMQGMTSGLDENSTFVPPTDFSDLKEDLDQQFGGVGIEVAIDRKSKQILVLSPLVNSPAYRAGVRAGDLIIEIDGQPTAGMPINDSVKLMKGKPGNPVALKIAPYGDSPTQMITIKREQIPVLSIWGDRRLADGSWDYRLVSNPDIAYLRLTTFGEYTADEFAGIYDDLGGKIRGMIIDVRDNPGGLLRSAVAICDYFVDDGTILTVRGRGGVIDDHYAASPENSIVAADLPVVVLVNELSASASEILSACLQDHGRATIVGQRTWGKGTVQRVFPLEGGKSALKFTTDTYWRPSGKNIHRLRRSEEQTEWGVQPLPDDEVEIDTDEKRQQLLHRRIRDIVELEPLDNRDDMPEPDFSFLANPPPPDESRNATDEHPESLPDEPTTSPDQVESESEFTDEPANDTKPGETTRPFDPHAPFVDRQLQRAIEVIDSRQPNVQRRAA